MVYREDGMEREVVVSTRWSGTWWKLPFSVAALVVPLALCYGMVGQFKACNAASERASRCHDFAGLVKSDTTTTCDPDSVIATEPLWSFENGHPVAMLHVRCRCPR